METDISWIEHWKTWNQYPNHVCSATVVIDKQTLRVYLHWSLTKKDVLVDSFLTMNTPLRRFQNYTQTSLIVIHGVQFAMDLRQSNTIWAFWMFYSEELSFRSMLINQLLQILLRRRTITSETSVSYSQPHCISTYF